MSSRALRQRGLTERGESPAVALGLGKGAAGVLHPRVGGELAFRLAHTEAKFRLKTPPPQQAAEHQRPRETVGW
jgi:hypothetical protein